MEITYKSNCNIVYSCRYHVVFCPKYRRSVLIDHIAERLENIFRQLAHGMQVEIFEMEIMPDHVHILLECDPQYGIAKVMKNLKGRSSRMLREEFPELKINMPSLWTNSYFISTVSEVAFEVIQKYIQNQKKYL